MLLYTPGGLENIANAIFGFCLSLSRGLCHPFFPLPSITPLAWTTASTSIMLHCMLPANPNVAFS